MSRALGRSQARPPIPWSAFVVSNGHNSNTITVDSIEQAVGKSIHELLADLVAYQSIRFWLLQHLVNCGFNGVEKRVTKAEGSLFVVLSRLSHLGIGVRVEPHTSHESDALACRRAS